MLWTKKTLLSFRLQRFFSLLYYMFYSFRFYIEFYDLFWVHFVYGVSKSWYLHLYGYRVDPAPFVAMTFLSSLNCLDIFVHWSYLCRSITLFTILFLWSRCQSFNQKKMLLMTNWSMCVCVCTLMRTHTHIHRHTPK